MARGVNKVILIGNLGANPELRQTPNGNAVSNITMATSSSWRDKQSGELQERTEWHRIIFFNRLAEIVSEYLHKGSKIYVEGSLRTRKWQDKAGNDRYTTEIIASEMQILDSRNSSGGNQGSNQGSSQGSYQEKQPATQTANGNSDQNNFDDDDIPF